MKFLNRKSCLQRIELIECKEQSMKHRNVGSISKIYTRKHSPTTKIHLRTSMNSRKSILKLRMMPIRRARSTRTVSSLRRNVINKSIYILCILIKSKLRHLNLWTGNWSWQKNLSEIKSRPWSRVYHALALDTLDLKYKSRMTILPINRKYCKWNRS